MKTIRMSLLTLMIVISSSSAIFCGNIVDLPYLNNQPEIDGVMNEKVWEKAAVFSDFKTMKPSFGMAPSQETVVKMYYNDAYIFVGVICYDTKPSGIKASLSNRDNSMSDDWAAFCIDTFNDNLSAYYFASNPLGIQNDGTLNQDGNPDGSPDFIWQCAAKISNNGYTVEFAIPFSSLRFPGKKELTMGFKAARQITRDSEEDDYPGYYPEKGPALAQFQKIRLKNIDHKNILEFIPAYTMSQPYELRNGTMRENGFEKSFGLTAKAGITSDITVDAAYNPDFSQIETDAGQIDVNLRYSAYYPEKRPFFLEGKDMLGFAGKADNFPLGEIVNTRTIVKPKLGLKLSGRLFEGDKFYFLYALDDYPGESAAENNIPGLSNKGTSVSVLRYAKTFEGDSYIGGIFTGRNFFDEYNYVTGIDGRVRLTGSGYIEYNAFGSLNKMHGLSLKQGGAVASVVYHYCTKNIDAYSGVYNISKDFKTQVGYLTRTGITTLPMFFRYRFDLNKKWIYKIETQYWGSHSLDRFSNMYEGLNIISSGFTMPLQSVLMLAVQAGNEIYSDKSFSRDAVIVDYSMVPLNDFSFYCDLTAGRFILYDPADPQQGKGKQIITGFQVQLTGHFKTGVDVSYSDLYSTANGNKFFDAVIYRNNTVIQFNEYFYLRGILEYDDYKKQAGLNLLAAFAYIPGTVIYLGYGSAYQKMKWENEHYAPSNNLMMTQKSFFFKASYLFRF